MKNIIIFIIIMVSCASSQTIYYVDSEGGDIGDDGNSGTSEGAAFLTWDAADAVASAGDTIVIQGTSTNERLNVTGSGRVWIDSLRYSKIQAGTFDLSYPDSIWTGGIDGGTESIAIDLGSGDDQEVFIGLEITNGSLFGVRCQGNENVTLIQCKLVTDASSAIYANPVDTLNVYSCLFIGSGVYAIDDNSTSSSHIDVVNSTFYGSYTNSCCGEVKADSITWKNNIVENTSSSSFDVSIRLDDVSEAAAAFGTNQWDYNIYNAAASEKFRFSAFLTTISVWQDSVNNYDTGSPIGGEANSDLDDPLLQNISTTCTITDSSPAWASGLETIWAGNQNIGYWQGPKPTGGQINNSGRVIIIN